MLEWIAAGSAVAVAGWVARARARGGRRRAWAEAVERAAASFEAARTSTAGSALELRAEVSGRTVTVRVHDASAPGDLTRVSAETELADPENTRRFYFGWDAPEVPEAVRHIPELPFPPLARVDGALHLRGEAAEVAERFLTAATLLLLDARRAGDAEGLEVIARGGHLSLVLHAPWPEPLTLERAAAAAARLAEIVDRASRLVPEEDTAAAPDGPACALCDDASPTLEQIVRCASCAAPFHEGCFRLATACVRCGETRAVPLGIP